MYIHKVDYAALRAAFSLTTEERNARNPVTTWRRQRRIKITGRALKRERAKHRAMLEQLRRLEARTGRRKVPVKRLQVARKVANDLADNLGLLEGTLEALKQEAL